MKTKIAQRQARTQSPASKAFAPIASGTPRSSDTRPLPSEATLATKYSAGLRSVGVNFALGKIGATAQSSK